MGGQQDKFFEQKRRQHQFVMKDASKPVMRLYLILYSLFGLVGYTCRGVFGITGGAHQFMHQDRGHYHSVSVFICITGGKCGSDSLVAQIYMYGWRLEMSLCSTDWFGIPVC